MWSSISLVLAILALPGHGASLPPSASPVLVVHERAAIPEAWTRVRAADDDEVLSLRIAVKQHRALDEADILARSNPASPLYGQYLGARDLRQLLDDATTHDARKLSWAVVERWVADNAIAVVRRSSSSIHVEMTARQARSALVASFSLYTNSRDEDGAVHARTEQYSLPSHVSRHVDYVYPTVHFFGARSTKDAPKTLEARQRLPEGPFDCTKYNCPRNISERYAIDYTPASRSASTLAIAGFLEQYPSHEDWSSFMTKFVGTTQERYSTVTLDGGLDPDTVEASGSEAMLDLEYSTPFTGPLAVTYYSVGGRAPTLGQPGNVTVPADESENEPFLDFFDHLLAQETVPQVITMSYTDDEQTVPYSYAVEVCERISQLALRGVTVLAASGDAGTQGTRRSDCKGPDNEDRFVPTFPASCPWVTTVGATAAYGGPASYSSGGFSNYFARPAWQQDAVQGYLDLMADGTVAQPNTTWFNSSGRGYPDLSLLGNDYLVVWRGFAQPLKGTSASTPVVASMVALLNDLRLAQGKPVLGFLNPRLYAAAASVSNNTAAFIDVLDGRINGCASAEHAEPGFEAAAGWDAASGLGEPLFKQLRALLV
ncbi:tripeptidyl-peptidase 1 [Microdochium trichocladiopsis]|uniref:tripeptidyl-peptidase II n=1 Tax=Microdochium trichocladiopsis TaxID=1682393 RepID=A0A9P9BG92_9PEZI|nr:tripeptidyl-peptidase 1 [Microdochium trichocladiopsis]KAH7014444.1 tripeptidyl-peptidase 1 [Microdochium trichocladiopsis]